MDLKESARQWVLRNLPFDRSDAALVTHLESLDAHGLLVAYHNWISRLIRPTPRQVRISQSLQARFPLSPYAAAVQQIVSDIEQGADLRPYLSTGVQIAAQVPTTPKKLNRRRDLDLLLTDWGMHHMHLSTDVGTDGFVARTHDLLFAVFRPQAAYLIDIMAHGAWTEENLLRILHKELPEAKATQVLRGVVGLSYEPTKEQHQQLRNAGGGVIKMIDGEAVLPGHGMTTAGTSVKATQDSDRLLEGLEWVEETWAKDPQHIRDEALKQGWVLPLEPVFEFWVGANAGVGVRETATAQVLRLL